MIRCKILVLTLFTSLNILNAQITPQEALQQMGKGINLGNTLEPPTEAAWNNPKAEEYYFASYVQAGFKTVRIPVRWDEHTLKTSPYTIDADWLNRVEQVVDWGLSRGLFIIINSHHDNWIKTDYATQTTRERFDAIWTQIAARFKNKSEKLFFEIINEPRTAEHEGLTQVQMNELNARILSIIRQDNPTRIVVYSGKGWSNSPDLLAAAIPNDNYIMGYFHSYDPWNFAGEAKGSWGTDADKSALSNKFNEVSNWAKLNNVAVMLSEFGATSNCDYNSRMKHYAAYVEECIKSNIAFMAWDDGGDFGIFQRSSNSWNEIKDILIYNSLESPTNIVTEIVEGAKVLIKWENRASNCESIIIEKRINNSNFSFLTELSSNSRTFEDDNIEEGNFYYYRVIAHITNASKRYSYPSKVYSTPTSREPFHGNAMPVPGTIQAEDYDIGGEGLSYHETTTENIPGAYRPNEAVDIEARNTGGYQLSYVEKDEWLEYTIDVSETGNYDISIDLASMEGGGTFKLYFPNSSSSTINVPSTDSWQTTTTSSSSVNLQAGEQIMRLKILSIPAFNIDKIVFSKTVTGLIETSSSFVKISPNPVRNGVLNIELNSEKLERNYLFKLHDINGKCVYSKTIAFTGSQIYLNIKERTNLKPSVYFLDMIGSNSQILRKKIIVE